MTPWGKYLQTILDKRKLTLREFADLVGEKSHGNIGHMMHGRTQRADGPPRKPPLDKMEAWAVHLRLPPHEREAFVRLAELEHTPEPLRRHVARIERLVLVLARSLADRGYEIDQESLKIIKAIEGRV